MRIITKPTVTLVAHTQFVGHPTYLIPPDGTDAERLGAFAAKGCYDSYGEGGRSVEANQLQVIEQAHGSVLEHASFSLFIEGITRGLSLELNRHRHFAISQRSTRYTAEEDAAIVLSPMLADLENRRGSLSVLEQGVLDEHIWSSNHAIREYRDQVTRLLAWNPDKLTGTELRKWARGIARDLLPHCLETRGTWTTNYRAVRHFIASRTSLHAEAEIRRLAYEVFRVVEPLAPTYFGDVAYGGARHGVLELIFRSGKV